MTSHAAPAGVKSAYLRKRGRILAAPAILLLLACSIAPLLATILLFAD
ncbi:MAG: hypothetical protein M0D54_10080 [Hyphomonadaceae bacterium JAD_PAG50586_4]|nr:MAG: hypothetical protein M0D54_10080 [Hyphomonadaceae bacterium JAD_PAG50586_4]